MTCFFDLVAVAGTVFEVVVVGLNIFGEINFFASFELLGAVEYDGVAVVVGVLVVTGKPNTSNIFAAFGNVGVRDFIFGEDGSIGALGDAGAAVDAGVRVNVEEGILFLGFTGDDALYGADFHTATVAETQTGNNVSHNLLLFMR